MTHLETTPCPPAAERSQRPRWNFAVDLLSVTVFAALAGTGFLLEWGFPHGRPSGGGAWTWLGLGRHGWGELHLWFALASVAVVVAHVVLHWAWIRSCWRRFLGAAHRPLALVVGAFILVCLIGPFVIPVQPALGGSEGAAGPPPQGRGHD